MALFAQLLEIAGYVVLVGFALWVDPRLLVAEAGIALTAFGIALSRRPR